VSTVETLAGKSFMKRLSGERDKILGSGTSPFSELPKRQNAQKQGANCIYNGNAVWKTRDAKGNMLDGLSLLVASISGYATAQDG